MGLIYDIPDLAALTLTRLAAEEAEGPGALEGRMRRRRTRKQNSPASKHHRVPGILLGTQDDAL
jgi:hypothetical protein